MSGVHAPARGTAPWRILNTEPRRLSEGARQALRALGEVTEIEADRELLTAHVGEYQVLFIALRNTIDREILDRAKALRCIVTPTTGVNHIDMATAAARGIDVLSLRGETRFLEDITATAELTWGLLLALIRKLPQAHASVLRGEWTRDEFRGIELKGRTLGVVGYGRLGKMVAAYAHAFRMTVLACDRQQRPSTPEVEFVGLEQVLERSDVVSIHLPLNDETRGIIDASCFERMRPGAIFLNTARGEIVDEAALLAALASGKVAGAAVDVLSDETSVHPGWLARNDLLAYARQHDNVLITPHIGGVTSDSTEKTNLFMIGKLASYLRDAPPLPAGA